MIHCHAKLIIQFQNVSSAAIEVWEWMSNFIPHFTGYLITYPCGIEGWSMSYNLRLHLQEITPHPTALKQTEIDKVFRTTVKSLI